MIYSSIPVSKARFIHATVDDIERLVSKWDKEVGQDVAKLLNDAQSGPPQDVLNDLAEKLSNGDFSGAFLILQDALELTEAIKKVFNGLKNTTVAAGEMVAAELPAIRGAHFIFDQLNPTLIEWLQTYRLNLIREMNDTTLNGIRAALLDGQRAGRNPRVIARDIKTIIGLTNRQQQAVLNFRKELEGFHARRSASAWNLGGKISRANGYQSFEVDESGKPMDGIQERRLRDFRYDSKLDAAMKSGKPLKPEQIDKMVDAYAAKYRKYRAETIARTETMRAASMGVQEAWRQAIAAGTVPEALVRRFWKVAHDERTCPICNAIPKMNPNGVTMGTPFATTKGPVFLPPAHPDCRCHPFIRLMEPAQLGLPQF